MPSIPEKFMDENQTQQQLLLMPDSNCKGQEGLMLPTLNFTKKKQNSV